MTIQLNRWRTLNWYKPENRRYYCAELHQDLFGQWLITRTWGSAIQFGRQVHEPVETPEHGEQLLTLIARQRQRKHYQLTTPGTD